MITFLADRGSGVVLASSAVGLELGFCYYKWCKCIVLSVPETGACLVPLLPFDTAGSPC